MSNQSQKPDHQKNIAEQFTGLDMETLIGGPLAAASAAQQQLATSTSEFLEEVGFPSTGPQKKNIPDRK